MKRFLTAAALASLLFAGCADGGGERAQTLEGTPTTESTTTTEPDQEVGDLNARLLTVADLPTGFSEGSAFGEDDEEDAEDESESKFCKEGFGRLEETPEKQEAEREFKKGEASLFGAAGLNQTISEYENKEQAQDLLDQFIKAMDTCRSFEETDDEGSTFKGTFSPLSFPKLGDQTYATHMSAEGGPDGFNISVGADFVIIRKGKVINLLATISFGAPAIPATDLEAIARKSVEKL